MNLPVANPCPYEGNRGGPAFAGAAQTPGLRRNRVVSFRRVLGARRGSFSGPAVPGAEHSATGKVVNPASLRQVNDADGMRARLTAAPAYSYLGGVEVRAGAALHSLPRAPARGPLLSLARGSVPEAPFGPLPRGSGQSPESVQEVSCDGAAARGGADRFAPRRRQPQSIPLSHTSAHAKRPAGNWNPRCGDHLAHRPRPAAPQGE